MGLQSLAEKTFVSISWLKKCYELCKRRKSCILSAPTDRFRASASSGSDLARFSTRMSSVTGEIAFLLVVVSVVLEIRDNCASRIMGAEFKGIGA